MPSADDFAGLVLVDVGASTPVGDPPGRLDVQRLALGYAGRVAFKHWTIEGDADLCSFFGISTPGVVLIENGAVIDRLGCDEPEFSERSVLAILMSRLPSSAPDTDCDDGSCHI